MMINKRMIVFVLLCFFGIIKVVMGGDGDSDDEARLKREQDERLFQRIDRIYEKMTVERKKRAILYNLLPEKCFQGSSSLYSIASFLKELQLSYQNEFVSSRSKEESFNYQNSFILGLMYLFDSMVYSMGLLDWKPADYPSVMIDHKQKIEETIERIKSKNPRQKVLFALGMANHAILVEVQVTDWKTVVSSDEKVGTFNVRIFNAGLGSYHHWNFIATNALRRRERVEKKITGRIPLLFFKNAELNSEQLRLFITVLLSWNFEKVQFQPTDIPRLTEIYPQKKDQGEFELTYASKIKSVVPSVEQPANLLIHLDRWYKIMGCLLIQNGAQVESLQTDKEKKHWHKPQEGMVCTKKQTSLFVRDFLNPISYRTFRLSQVYQALDQLEVFKEAEEWILESEENQYIFLRKSGYTKEQIEKNKHLKEDLRDRAKTGLEESKRGIEFAKKILPKRLDKYIEEKKRFDRYREEKEKRERIRKLR